MLENRIEELTKKIEDLAGAVVVLTNVMLAPRVDPVSAPLDKIAPVKEEPQAKKEESSAPEASAACAAENVGEQATGGEQATVLTYDDHVKPATLKVAQKHGRDKAKAILTSFGVAGAQKLTEEQWPAYLAACEEALK